MIWGTRMCHWAVKREYVLGPVDKVLYRVYNRKQYRECTLGFRRGVRHGRSWSGSSGTGPPRGGGYTVGIEGPGGRSLVGLPLALFRGREEGSRSRMAFPDGPRGG